LQPQFLNELSLTLKGLSESEIQNILALSVSDDGDITRSDLSLIFEQKQQVIQKSGILEMIPLKESLADIGGLESLKKWLQRKAKIFKYIDQAEVFGVDVPKGVLIAGMPGCGKSLNAKAAAKLFGVPLLRMDMGRLMGKYVGESEANMRKAIALAEAISPCVLWIDELEKAFAGVGGEGGGADVTTRLFDTFLTWLQEKDSMAFVVATANDIAKMPPELLRKGRFDEIFYVGLPKPIERKKIFEIHIRKRRPSDLGQIDLDKLSAKTEGYSGADIEGVVRDSVEEAFSKDQDKLTTEGILQAIQNTHSLSEIMKESLDKMNKLYQERKFKNASV
jgi:SpoVK/Ycf46/Vps4 family AAA+-type ATPase